MAVGVDVPLLRPVAVALSLDQITQRVQVGVDVVGVGDLAESLADQFVPGVARELAERAIDALKAAIGRDDRHPHPAVVEGPAEALLGSPEVVGHPPQRDDEQMHCRPETAGEHESHHAALEFVGVVGRSPDHGDREEQRDPHDEDGDRQLSPCPVEREPRHGEDHQRAEDARGVAARVSEQRDDEEVGEREDRLWPGGQSGPRHPERERDHDREEGRGDQHPWVGDRDPCHGKQRERQEAGEDEGCDPPADIHAFEEPPRVHVQADRARPARVVRATAIGDCAMAHSQLLFRSPPLDPD